MKKGFTLSEVLITLSIIGVISSLTIPNLMNKYHEKATSIKLKKIHSILSQAYTQAKYANGPSSEWFSQENDNALTMFLAFRSYIRGIKDCVDEKDKSCISADYIKSLDGKNYLKYADVTTERKTVLPDGTLLWFFYAKNEKCEYSESEEKGDVCGNIKVDLNGKKGPNAFGRDVFIFTIKQNSITPGGGIGDLYYGLTSFCNKSGGKDNRNGVGCTAWVIEKGNMDYLRRQISWDE